MPKQKFVIIDGNAIVHRAYHAIPPMTTKNGTLVNAVYGFVSMLLKVWKELEPTHLAVSFDVGGGTFRHERFAAYKATRVKADQDLYDQIPLVHKAVEAFNIPIYEKKGYEADDVIGAVVKELNKDDVETYIVTGDMDTLQLISSNTKVYTLRKGMSDIIIYDSKATKERYGFLPERLVDFKGLAGDASDNIPGVPGIGEKTATDLITKIGGIEDIYKALKDEHSKVYKEFKPGVITKLKAGEKSAFMSKELATIETKVPGLKFSLKDTVLHEFDKKEVLRFLQEYEFVSLLRRVPGLAAEAKAGVKAKAESSPKISRGEFKYQQIKDKKEVAALLNYIKQDGQFACSALTAGGNVIEAELKGLAVAVGSQGFFIGRLLVNSFVTIFQDHALTLVGHNLKELVKALAVLGIKEIRCKFFDTMIGSYLLQPGSRAHDLPGIVLKQLGKELTAGSGQDSLFGVDPKVATYEAHLALLIYPKLVKELKKLDNLGLMEKLEMPLIPVLANMELNGIVVDKAKLKNLSERVKKEIDKVTKKIYQQAGKEFNVASPLQLREVLFEDLKIPVQGIKKGKTGLSTSAEQLEKMRGLHPIIEEIEVFRELAKLQNTYIDVLPTLVNKKTGRIHTSFNQAVAATGRLSSSDPNLQNIPIRTELGREVREAFVAKNGYILVSADYSQIELRIVASLAKDKKLLEIFNQGEDVHQATAAAINKVSPDKVTKQMRRAAKEVNFGVLYGMGTYGLAWRAGLTHWRAKEFIDKYFEEFSGVKKYIEQTLEFTKKEGYCETLFGRRRYIPELKAANHQLRAAGERMATNHPIQGTAADLMKMGMIEVFKELKKDPRPGAKILLQVHDELVLEVKKGLENKVGDLLKKEMESVATLNVPILVEVKYGHNWGKLN